MPLPPVSPSTNLLLIDATARAGTLTLPNPSTIDGNILIIRDLYSTISQTSTLAIQTQPPLAQPLATLSMPGAFVTLLAAPLGNRQYHILGGTQILDQHVSSLKTDILSTGTLFVKEFYPFDGITVSSFQSPSTFVDHLATQILTTAALQLSASNTLTASNSQLYLDGLPLNRGKFFTVQEIQAAATQPLP